MDYTRLEDALDDMNEKIEMSKKIFKDLNINKINTVRSSYIGNYGNIHYSTDKKTFPYESTTDFSFDEYNSNTYFPIVYVGDISIGTKFHGEDSDFLLRVSDKFRPKISNILKGEMKYIENQLRGTKIDWKLISGKMPASGQDTYETVSSINELVNSLNDDKEKILLREYSTIKSTYEKLLLKMKGREVKEEKYEKFRLLFHDTGTVKKNIEAKKFLDYLSNELYGLRKFFRKNGMEEFSLIGLSFDTSHRKNKNNRFLKNGISRSINVELPDKTFPDLPVRMSGFNLMGGDDGFIGFEYTKHFGHYSKENYENMLRIHSSVEWKSRDYLLNLDPDKNRTFFESLIERTEDYLRGYEEIENGSANESTRSLYSKYGNKKKMKRELRDFKKKIEKILK